MLFASVITQGSRAFEPVVDWQKGRLRRARAQGADGHGYKPHIFAPVYEVET